MSAVVDVMIMFSYYTEAIIAFGRISKAARYVTVQDD